MIRILANKFETGSQRKQTKCEKNAKYFKLKFFHKILLTLLGGMWKNCSVMELLQILTHKLLISDSDKFFKKPSIL